MDTEAQKQNSEMVPCLETDQKRKKTGKRRKLSAAQKRKLLAWLLIIVFIPAVITFGMLQWQDRHFYIISFLIIIASLLPFLLVFEKRRPRARELVIIAVLVAIAVAGRAAFFMVPQFKPIAAIVIIAGASLGCETGFVVGSLTMFVSNIFVGQGPWTPWQMFAMGIIGFIAGLLFKKEIKTKLQLALFCIYGAVSVFIIYGGIVDTASFLMGSAEISWKGLLAIYAAGAVFNLIHALSTVIFLLILTKPILNKLKRVKIKYGLIE